MIGIQYHLHIVCFSPAIQVTFVWSVVKWLLQDCPVHLQWSDWEHAMYRILCNLVSLVVCIFGFSSHIYAFTSAQMHRIIYCWDNSVDKHLCIYCNSNNTPSMAVFNSTTSLKLSSVMVLMLIFSSTVAKMACSVGNMEVKNCVHTSASFVSNTLPVSSLTSSLKIIIHFLRIWSYDLTVYIWHTYTWI